MFYQTIVPTKYSEASIIGVFKKNNIEYTFIQFKESTEYLRIHDRCFTSEIMGSLKCDCNDQLEYSLDFLSKNGGILIYTPFEGRGIGAIDKIRAYQLQNQGHDTFKANELLGFKKECRDYEYLDELLIDIHPKNHELITDIEKVLRQRNTLLKRAKGILSSEILSTLSCSMNSVISTFFIFLCLFLIHL
mgnify:CR=1 FL=1